MKILNTLLISLLAYSASAQVGIGTSTPTVPLDIEAADAAIDINNTSTDPLIHFQVSGTTNFTIGTDVTDSKKFKIGTTALETGTAVTVQSTGEVGIGTTSPQAPLHIKQTTADAYGVYVDDGTSWISLVPNLATGGYNPISEAGDVGLFFSTDNNSAAVAGNGLVIAAHSTSSGGLKIEEDGKVGIGTSSPDVLLEVQGGTMKVTDDAGEVLLNPGGAVEISRAAVANTAGYLDFKDLIGNDYDCRIRQTAADGLAFDVGGDGTIIEGAIHIASDGDVGIGIGTATPTATLDVDGSAIFNESGAAVDFRVEGDVDANLLFVDGSAGFVGVGTASPSTKLDVNGVGTFGNAQIGVVSSGFFADGSNHAFRQYAAGHLYFQSQSGTTTHMFIENGGNVGIGTSSPGYTLDVSGDINYSGSLSNVSDERYKKDINKIDNALGLIAQFDGYNYKFRKDEFPELKFDTTAQIGFIAQEIQKALPQLVSENDSGYLSVNYIKVVPILLMGMKEQQAIIEAQKAENESQKQEIETIKAEASSSSVETNQKLKETTKKLAELEAKLNALLLLNSQGAVVTAEN